MKDDRSLYRYEYDLLRIVLTLLVVVGHAAYYNIITPFGGIHYQTDLEQLGLGVAFSQKIITGISLWISSFHMPGFFMLSGMLYSINGENKSIASLLSRKAKRLIVPLLFVWFAWNVPIKYISGYYDGVSVSKVILQVFFPNRVYLWYLEALFFVFVLVYILHRLIKNNWSRIGVSVVFVVVGIILSRSCGDYVPLGNPLKYVIWFEFGCCFQSLKKWLMSKTWWTTKMCLGMLETHLTLYLCVQVFNIHNNLVEYLVFPATIMPAIIYCCEKVSNKIPPDNAKVIHGISSYSFGVYLYAEPINYLILFAFARLFGIGAFSLEIVSVALIFSRIIISISIAMIVVRVLKSVHLENLY